MRRLYVGTIRQSDGSEASGTMSQARLFGSPISANPQDSSDLKSLAWDIGVDRQTAKNHLRISHFSNISGTYESTLMANKRRAMTKIY